MINSCIMALTGLFRKFVTYFYIAMQKVHLKYRTKALEKGHCVSRCKNFL